MPVNILNLAGLTVLDFKETDTDYHVQAEPAVISRLCPHCGRSKETEVHAQKSLFIRDLPSHGKSVVLHLNVPRLRCKHRNQTFTATVPKVDTTRQMTERLVKWVGRQAQEHTYAEVAKQVGVDEKTVRNVFDAYVPEREKQFKRETPVWLGIDEIKLGHFRAVFTNILGRTLMDMLPDRYGPVQLNSGYVDQFRGESYNYTDSGEILIHKASITKPSGLATQPCVRFGKYQISSIEAVDVAVDAIGQNIASVRAHIVFKPEEWMVAGREDPRAARAWAYFAANEAAQWMYRLKKSGDSYFYTGPASKL